MKKDEDIFAELVTKPDSIVVPEKDKVDKVLNKEQNNKLASDAKQINKVLGIKKKGKLVVKKLPDHIRKAYITINDKHKGDPISIIFEGNWVPSDINLAGKFLIIDFQMYVRDKAMSNK